MIKPLSSALLLVSVGCFAHAEPVKSFPDGPDTVRLVISGDISLSSAQSMERTSSVSHKAKGLSTIEVNAGEADAMIQLLSQQPGIRAVERDIVTSTPPTPAPGPKQLQQMAEAMGLTQSADLIGNEPNDPQYINQYSWSEPSGFYPGQHDILSAYKSSVPLRKLRIGMTDSGFYDREDIDYAGGYNFSTLAGAEVSPIFFEDAYNPECTSPHGGSVAHIIGANTDNGVGVAGIVDADLYGVRVMNCGTGLLSEMSNGIRWLAGDTSLPGVTPIDEPVDIINVSMGALVDSCPVYVQDAIDFAYNQGVAVVAAAGNDGVDAAGYTPANCNNLITVASVDRQRTQSDFTNFGSVIDVSALGELVMSEGSTGYSFWFGTSFSTPNVVGMAGLAKQADPSMTVNELFGYVTSATRAFEAGETENSLGSGNMDAKLLMDTVNADIAANTPLLRPALDGSIQCQEAILSGVPFIDGSGDPVDACAIFEIDTASVEENPAYPNYSLYRVPQGTSYALSNAELVKASTDRQFVLYNLDPQTYDYGFVACDLTNSSCASTTLTPVKDDLMDESRYCVKP